MPQSTFEPYDFTTPPPTPKRRGLFEPSTFTSDPYEQEMLQKIADASAYVPDVLGKMKQSVMDYYVTPQWEGAKKVAGFLNEPIDAGMAAEGGKAFADTLGYTERSRPFREKVGKVAGNIAGMGGMAPGLGLAARQFIDPEAVGEEASAQTTPANLMGLAVPFTRGWMSAGLDLTASSAQGINALMQLNEAKTPAEKRAALMQLGLAAPGIVSPGMGAKPKGGSVTTKTGHTDVPPSSSILDDMEINHSMDTNTPSSGVVPDKFRESRVIEAQNLRPMGTNPSTRYAPMFARAFGRDVADRTPEFPSDRWNAGLDEHTSIPDEQLGGDIWNEVRERGVAQELENFKERVRQQQENQLTKDIWAAATEERPSNAIDISEILNNPRNQGAPPAPEVPIPRIPPMGESWVDRLGPYTGPRTDADAFQRPGPAVPPTSGMGGITGGPGGAGNMFTDLEQNGFGIGEPLEPRQPSPFAYEGVGERVTGEGPPPNWLPDEPTPRPPDDVEFVPDEAHREYIEDDAELLPSSGQGVDFSTEEPNVIALPSHNVSTDDMMALKNRGYRPAGRNANGDLLFQKVTKGQPTPESMAGVTVGGPKKTPRLLKPGETRIFPAGEVSPARLGQWRRRGYIVEPQPDGSFKVTGGGTPQDVPVLETEVGNIRPTVGRGEKQAAGISSPPQSPLGALGGPPAIPGASSGPPPLPVRAASSGAPGGSGGASGGGQPPSLPPTSGSGGLPNIPPNLPNVHPVTGKQLKPPTKWDYVADAANVARTTLSAGDASAAFRQGIGLITRPSFWKHLVTTYPQSIFSEKYAQQYDDILRQRALFKKRVGPSGQLLNSFAEDAGLFLADLNHQVGKWTGREETMISKLAENTPALGRLVRGSNRGYTNFLNHVRADVFESLVKDSKGFGIDALTNIDYARNLAKFVNAFSGRGSLGALEPASKALSAMFFSPRLIASRMQMIATLNPMGYAMRSPQLRQEALKSLFGIAAFGATITTLGKMAGGEVGTDPESSDFGKIKIGNTRFDPYGGLQQWAVLMNRMATGRYKSSNPDIPAVDLGNPRGPYDPSKMDILQRFVRGKVHPIVGLGWSLLAAQKEMSGEKMKFNTLDEQGMDMVMKNAIAQRFIPLLAQDVYEVWQNEPGIVPPVIAAVFGGLGGGVQSYGGREEFKEENIEYEPESSFEEDDFQ